MREFNFQLSTKIYFGTQMVTKALESEKDLIKGNVFVITTGRSLREHGHLQNLIADIKKLPFVEKVAVYEEISANPKLAEVNIAVALGISQQVNIIIGFGGGSAIDAAKAVAVGIGANANVEEYLLAGKEPDERTLPIIAIPTTAGTGSELSKGAILTSEEHHIKTGIRGERILPKVAIVDSYYTRTIPEKITMETGFDVLAHAIETYMACKSNAMSEMLSEKAIKIVAENLPRLKKNLDDYEARENMCFASMLMGINLATVGTCFPHRMQYAIGAETDTSHAAGLLTVYPAWIKEEYAVNSEKVKQVLLWMGYEEIHAAEEAKARIHQFLSKLGIAYSLQDLGVKKEMLDELTGAVTGNLANDKLAEVENCIQTIFMESL